MNTLTMTLRYHPQPLREASAWYLPGDDPQRWLAEITRWQVPQSSLDLFLVPTSSQDRHPAGVLVVLPEDKKPKTSSYCIPYGTVSTALYLPVEGRLHPEVSDDELQSLLTPGYTYVWHPVAGFVGFEPTEKLCLADLLSVGPSTDTAWDFAQPGVTLSRSLLSVLPAEPLTIETVMQQVQDDIGTNADDLSDLPPSRQELEEQAGPSFAQQMKQMWAKMALWFTKQVPASGNRDNWINRLEAWASEQISNAKRKLDAARNQEIDRLMDLLQTDPDRGLKYALPLAGDGHRGTATGGSRLTQRNTDFNLNRLGGGGGPAAFWDLSADYHSQLAARYRELANREMHLGRYRRAAYIFAELLGDYHAAAGALVAGHHWREAAVLYRDRLNTLTEAARCLEKGGHWLEAIECYQELKAYEKVGDLYTRLEQPREAREAYHQAVGKCRGSGDYLGAARIFEQKLHSVEDALKDLSTGWKESSQSIQCLKKTLELLARLGRHETSQGWVSRLQQEHIPAQHRQAVVEVLADTATKYPDRTTRDQAADCTRVVVARELPLVTNAKAQQLLSAVSRLVPEDRLLARDCKRYLHQATQPRQKVTPQRKTLNGDLLQPPLGGDAWRAAIAAGELIFLAGRLGDRLVLNRCDYSGEWAQDISWALTPHLAEAPLLLAADPFNPQQVIIHPLGGPPSRNEASFEPTDECPLRTVVGTMRGMSQEVIAVARPGTGMTWLIEERFGQYVLLARGSQGEPISTHTLCDAPPFELKVLPAPLHACDDKVFAAVGNQLFQFRNDKTEDVWSFGQTITSLTGSAPGTVSRIAVTFPSAGLVIWDEHGHTETLGNHLDYPIACFTRDGCLIVAAGRTCEIYSTQNRRLRLMTEIPNLPSKPIAILPHPKNDHFGLAFADGKIGVYRVS